MPVPPDDAAAALTVLNARRFRLLQTLIALGEPVSTPDLFARLGPPSTGSLYRDLIALEEVGLLAGIPATDTRQQGQRVLWTASATPVLEVLRRLTEALTPTSWHLIVAGTPVTVTRRQDDPRMYDFSFKLGDEEHGFYAASMGGHEMSVQAMQEQAEQYVASLHSNNHP